MARLSPSERSLHARIAALESWARTSDPSARTEPARTASAGLWEAKVVAEAAERGEVLTPEQITRMAAFKRRAHFQRMAYLSARARRKAAADG